MYDTQPAMVSMASATDENSNALMNRNQEVDPLKKREEFAVSLRRSKKKEIIQEKRRKLILRQSNHSESMSIQASINVESSTDDNTKVLYQGCEKFFQTFSSASVKTIIAEKFPSLNQDVESPSKEVSLALV